MPSDRLKHDTAFAASHAVTGMLSGLLRPEEENQLFGEIYQVLRAMLEAYDALRRREEVRLCRPSRN